MKNCVKANIEQKCGARASKTEVERESSVKDEKENWRAVKKRSERNRTMA